MTNRPALLCAAYIRTSTDDQQSPDDSKRWQLDIARRLIGPAGGEIVAVYHDIDVTRELPWTRRPEASRLLEDVADPRRGWSALVIAEPQRAFSGGQFQLVFPQLTHYGVDLWVPELGGRINPDSEGHEMLMSLFGGLSKAERRRLQTRVRSAVLAHGAAGRWLGGRPNYGYRLVDTDVPHPQRQKAIAGIRLRTLVPDPDTAPIVQGSSSSSTKASATARSRTSSNEQVCRARARSARNVTRDPRACGAARSCGRSSRTRATSATRSWAVSGGVTSWSNRRTPRRVPRAASTGSCPRSGSPPTNRRGLRSSTATSGNASAHASPTPAARDDDARVAHRASTSSPGSCAARRAVARCTAPR